MIYDLAIIGGGAAGISAYISFKKKNPFKKVIILEHNSEILKKINSTGGGKCNFTNGFLNYSYFTNGKYFKELINDKSCYKILNMFDYLEIKYFKDDENRYYPYSQTAKTVVSLMSKKVDVNDVVFNAQIKDIKHVNDKYNIILLNNIIESKNILISVGNKNSSKLGSDGSLFPLIKKLNHTFTNIYPSDIWINVKEKQITKSLSGLRCKAHLTLLHDNDVIKEETGELLFKDQALSGIVSFNISNSIGDLYKNNIKENIRIKVDFLPDFEIVENDIDSYIHPQIAKTLDKYKYIYNNSNSLYKEFIFNVESLGEFEHAQAANGGLTLSEICTSTLESKIHKGLYFAGDVLDVSAPCGGFNLSFAFLSGMKVGEEIE